MGEPSSARSPPEVERMRNSLLPSCAGSHPMPASWESPKRSPLAQLRSMSSVRGSEPAGPGDLVWRSKTAGSEARMSAGETAGIHPVEQKRVGRKERSGGGESVKKIVFLANDEF